MQMQLQNFMSLLDLADQKCYEAMQHPDDSADRIENMIRLVQLFFETLSFLETFNINKVEKARFAAKIQSRLLSNLYYNKHEDMRMV